MIATRRTIVHNTDPRWFSYFRPANVLERIDEVVFWRPSSQSYFRALQEGEPFFFRLKAPRNSIAGFGFFALQTIIPVPLAWDLFGDRNGDPDFQSLRGRIAEYRKRSSSTLADPLNCLVLRDAMFLPNESWITWGRDKSWSSNIVAFKRYDLDQYPGTLLDRLLRTTSTHAIRETAPPYQVRPTGSRATALREVLIREGQGTFRARLLQLYDQRCAITQERSLPVLEAAHIQPYQGPESNHVQNGILLRADFHRLYDTGYLTVTPDYALEVSRRLHDDFDNGAYYYGLRGQRVRIPDLPEHQPSRSALRWHNDNTFLG
jgi:putative restriction endonuclease